MTVMTKRFTDINRLTLWGEGENSKARLVFGFRDGYPRITVFTGTDAKGKDGVINFPTDAPTMAYIATLLKELAEGQPGTKHSVGSYTTKYEDNKPTKDKILVSNAYIGKSKEGLVYFSLISENKPKIVFPFKQSVWHTFKDQDGMDISESKVSCMMAIGISAIILNLLSLGMFELAKESTALGKDNGSVVQESGDIEI